MSKLQVTVFAKRDGPLTKRILLGPNGKVISDGSACVMSRGRARRVELSSARQLADLIGGLGSSEAITLGPLREGLPDEVEVATKHRVNGTSRPDLIARSQDYLSFHPGVPAFTLFDHDTKGLPDEVRARIKELGGFWPALTSVLPALDQVAHVTRLSTSGGLFRTDTGEAIPGSDGVHVYVLVNDGTDGERFLKTLHARCWLAGLGWMVGAGGQLLERSIIDRVVGSPERLVFEGPPVLDPPLVQDQESRRPAATEGEALDTVVACPPLTTSEKAKLGKLRAKEEARLAPDAAKERNAFIDRQAKELAQRTGIDLPCACRTIKRQCEGVLLPNVVLPFDDSGFAGSTVADVLADPARFEGATLADPLEGVDYGRCKARIMRRADGTLWINSFAHGRTAYELKFDSDAAKTALANEPETSIVDLFVHLVLLGDLDRVETEQLRNAVHKRTKISRRALNEKLKAAQANVKPRRASGDESRFTIKDKCLAYLKVTDTGGIVPIALANFAAFIIEDQICDDGAVEWRQYLIEGEINDGTPLPSVIVPVKEFVGAGWVGPRWGPRPIVSTGLGCAMLCEAIQTMSADAPTRRIFGHIGWRRVDGEWFYLHAGGAIGANGKVQNISVELGGELAWFQLPAPRDLRSAVKSSLKLLELRAPVAAAAWRAPFAEFCPVNFSFFEAGRTGSFKSAVTGVGQAHWGSRWGDGIHFPANWSGTTNSLEKMAFLVRDALFIIDDFAPSGSRHAANALHEKTEYLIRAQGNLSGRSRLTSDTALRPTYYPRGLIGSSGEDVPRGHSLRARMFIDQIGPDDIDAAKLRALQDAATRGLLAEAMAGYVQWIAIRANTTNLAEQLHETQNRLRQKFVGAHRRTPEAAASLMLGVKEFLDFATEIGAIGDLKAEALSSAAEQALCSGATAQATEHAQEDPVEMFINAIASALASGRAHLTSRDGTKPAYAPSLLGWRRITKTYERETAGDTYCGTNDDWSPQGDRIGWLASEHAWILPDESIAVIEHVLREQGRSIAISRNTLGKRLRETGWLIEIGKDSFTKVVNIGEGTARVFVFSRSRLFPSSEKGPGLANERRCGDR
jgi:hypothetical protein